MGREPTDAAGPAGTGRETRMQSYIAVAVMGVGLLGVLGGLLHILPA
ncbi:hypothetical protein [Methylobacterium sp. J-076]|nr:hypothetical protein [Methylobacterium sp. J-076]MCJ2012262.1 hypothetical protein [Methylobacterium sp. J-076]